VNEGALSGNSTSIKTERELATAYDELYSQADFDEHPFGSDKQYVEWVKKKLNSEIASYLQNGKVIDVGGGYGAMRTFLRVEQQYYNLDCSTVIIRYDRSRNRIIGSGLFIPFKANTFENAVSGDVLEHTDNKRGYLEECFRVIKQGGVFVISTPVSLNVSNVYRNTIWYYLFFIGSLFDRLKRAVKNTSGPQVERSEKIIDSPSDDIWLEWLLQDIGFIVIMKKRNVIHLPFGLDGWFWRKFADVFIDEKRFGMDIMIVCQKR
jgi:ubiquinone/menaquinone biosynthesis C-methylase UbiE